LEVVKSVWLRTSQPAGVAGQSQEAGDILVAVIEAGHAVTVAVQVVVEVAAENAADRLHQKRAAAVVLQVAARPGGVDQPAGAKPGGADQAAGANQGEVHHVAGAVEGEVARQVVGSQRGVDLAVTIRVEEAEAEVVIDPRRVVRQAETKVEAGLQVVTSQLRVGHQVVVSQRGADLQATKLRGKVVLEVQQRPNQAAVIAHQNLQYERMGVVVALEVLWLINTAGVALRLMVRGPSPEEVTRDHRC
jgi:hypothetical protein